LTHPCGDLPHGQHALEQSAELLLQSVHPRETGPQAHVLRIACENARRHRTHQQLQGFDAEAPTHKIGKDLVVILPRTRRREELHGQSCPAS
jgi:hypothetical protein